MSKRIDIEILNYLNKKKDSTDYISLQFLIDKHGMQIFRETSMDLSDKDFIRYIVKGQKIEQDNYGQVTKETIESIEVKITTEGRDYLIDYRNRNSTRRIAYCGIAIAIFSIIIAGLSLILQYLPKDQ